MAMVIKAGQLNPKLIKRLETVNVSDHLGEAKLVLSTSREKAKDLLRQTNAEAQSIRAEAAESGYEAGFRRGYEAGAKAGSAAAFEASRKEFKSEQRQLIEALHAMIEEFDKRKRDLFISAVNDVSQFATKVAEKVTRQIGATSEEAAVSNLEAALELVESKTDLVVRVHPKDHFAMERFVESFHERAAGSQHMDIVTDESIHPGGCRLSHTDGEVDATLETQLEQIALLMSNPREDARMNLLAQQLELLQSVSLTKVAGRLKGLTGLTMVADGLRVAMGSMCVVTPRGRPAIEAQVIGFRGEQTLLMPMTEPLGVCSGDRVTSCSALHYVPVGRQMIGRVLDGMGRPMDGKGSFGIEGRYPLWATSPAALTRRPIDSPLATGVRSIDAMHTVGKGQRIGLFAGTGVGKSVLMGMIARNTASDVTVVALVGERGREVGDFIRKDLGEDGLKKTVLVVSTSDKSPVLRVRACFVATSIAEYFRDQGADVLLLMDSTTRMAMAQRQIGLAGGEPPATKGYTPSVFALLPQLLERAGRTQRGSITGLYTVLVEGDDISEPVADAVRGTLDGHIWLSRKLSNRGHYPAVAPLESISRVMPDVVDEEHRQAAGEIRGVLAVWEEIEDLVNIGAYAAGANVEYDIAVQTKSDIDEFLRQKIEESNTLEQARDALLQVAGGIRELRDRLRRGHQAV